MSDLLWRDLREQLRTWTGLVLSDWRRELVLGAVQSLANDVGVASPEALLAAAITDAGEHLRDLLIARVSVGVTWFGRELALLDAALDRARAHCHRIGIDEVYVWSAGCSTGEEPYTIAMALLDRGLRPRILATDVNREVLRRATRARYARAALGPVPARWRERYFVDAGPDLVELDAGVRCHVSFARHNLASDPTPPAGWGRFDLIVCRNVLIYFDPLEAVAVARRLDEARRSTGQLVVGAVEQAMVSQSGTGTTGSYPAVASGSGPIKTPPIASGSGSGSGSGSASVSGSGTGSGTRPSGSHGRVDTMELDPEVHLRRGIAAKRADRLESAIEHLRRARFLAADRWLAPYLLGVCLEAVGKPDEAREAYHHAIAAVAAGGHAGLPDAELEATTMATTVSGACYARLAAIGSAPARR